MAMQNHGEQHNVSSTPAHTPRTVPGTMLLQHTLHPQHCDDSMKGLLVGLGSNHVSKQTLTGADLHLIHGSFMLLA